MKRRSLRPTARQVEVMKTIDRLTREKGYPPSIRELTSSLGLKSSDSCSRDVLLVDGRCFECEGRVAA